MRTEWLRLGAALAVAALAACRTAPLALHPTGAWEQQRPALQALAHFQLKGRVAVAAGNEGFNATLHWAQDGGRSQLNLEGPLGVGGAQVSAADDELTLVTSRGERLDSDAAHAALASRLGFDPPLSSLRYWVLGVPDPHSPYTEVLDSEAQRLSALTQSGWQINYAAYTSVGSQALPARLTLQRDTVRVRLLVDDWQL